MICVNQFSDPTIKMKMENKTGTSIKKIRHTQKEKESESLSTEPKADTEW